MSRMAELVAAAKSAGDPAIIAAGIPYSRFLGLSFALAEPAAGAGVERGDSPVILGTLTFSRTIIGNPVLPALHGGAIGALLESTAIVQLIWMSDTPLLPKTINITIEYLRTGKPVDTFARAQVTRHGRRVANVRIEAWQEDENRPITIAVAHFLTALPAAPEPTDPVTGAGMS